MTNRQAGRSKIGSKNKSTATVPFTHFVKQVQTDDDGKPIINKKGKEVKRLVPLKEKVDA